MSGQDAKREPAGWGPAGTPSVGLERRAFLKGVGAAGAGAAAVVATAATGAQAAESNEDQVRQRYSETEHVKRFYALNRL
jgi:hypothetical protein